MNFITRCDKKGFTLIEIIVVLVILGILALIALPSYFNWIQKANEPQMILQLKDVANNTDLCVSYKYQGLSLGTKIQNCLTENIAGFHNIALAWNAEGYFFGLVIQDNPNPSGVDVRLTCPNSVTWNYGVSPPAKAVVGVCGYPDDGSNPNVNKGNHIFLCGGIFSGMC